MVEFDVDTLVRVKEWPGWRWLSRRTPAWGVVVKAALYSRPYTEGSTMRLIKLLTLPDGKPAPMIMFDFTRPLNFHTRALMPATRKIPDEVKIELVKYKFAQALGDAS